MISIVIPTFNRGTLICRAIKSIINQKYNNWELLIVDDGSTDNTKEIIDKYLQDPRIKYIQKENSGAAHSRNIGIKESKGDYITFLDSDDEAKENWLEVLVRVINENKAEVICCGIEYYDNSNKKIREEMPAAISDLFNGRVMRFTNGGSFLLLRKHFEAVGGYDDDLQSGQHTEMALRLVPYLDNKGIEIFNVFQALVKIHIHEGDRIRTNFRSKYEGGKRSLSRHKKILKKYPLINSDYQGVVAYNASKIGLRWEALKYSSKSFRGNPSLKRFLRIIKYGFFS